MKHNLILTFIFMFTLSSCSVFDDEQSDDPVEAVVYDEQLVIRNNLPYDVYYFAVNKNSLALILWAPTVSEENRIEKNASISISLKEVYNDSPGAPIAVFYWDKDISEIFNIEIE
jgi:uncharacterized pyridoxamine 5'-phosphate oxidase family protein